MFRRRTFEACLEGCFELFIKLQLRSALVSFGPANPCLAWYVTRKRWGSYGFRNTVGYVLVRDPISRLTLQWRALLLTLSCWLDTSFRQSWPSSFVATASCSLVQSQVCILLSLGGIFSLPATATVRAFSFCCSGSLVCFSCSNG